jgi:uncharacterized Zn finger protein
MFYEWRPYLPLAERRKQAAKAAKKLAKKGQVVRPVAIEGRTIARSFWGKAWCDNLERYSDYANRMPRGRTSARNGSVVDLQIAAGRVTAVVSGSEVYQIAIDIDPLDPKRWQALAGECAGKIGSLLELLQGRFSDEVMQILARPKTGLFPSPQQIRMSCSCPDWATMCKHVAAALYGVGARLDEEPEIFFTLRQVDQSELVTKASAGGLTRPADGRRVKTLAADRLSDVFGIELDGAAPTPQRKQTASRPAAAIAGQRKAAASRPAATIAAQRKQAAASRPAAKTAKRGASTRGASTRGASTRTPLRPR